MTVLYLLSKHTDHFCSVSLVSKALWINEPLLEFKRSLFSLKIALRAKVAVKKQHKRLYPAALREIVHLGLIFHLYKAGKTSNLQGRRISRRYQISCMNRQSPRQREALNQADSTPTQVQSFSPLGLFVLGSGYPGLWHPLAIPLFSPPHH